MPEGFPIRKDIAPAQKTQQDTKGIPPISQEVIRENYEKSEDNGLLMFIQKALQGKAGKYQYKISDSISERLANDIKKIVGFDVQGYQNKIAANRIQHIEKRHGADGITDHSMENLHDLARIGYVIQNYDNVIEGNEQSVEYKNSDNTMAKTVVLQKKVGDGYYYVVEAVPDSKAKTLFVVSAYINKNDTFSEVGNAKSPNPDVQNALPTNASFSENTIPQSEENGTKIFKRSEYHKLNDAPFLAGHSSCPAWLSLSVK